MPNALRKTSISVHGIKVHGLQTFELYDDGLEHSKTHGRM